MPLRCLDPTGRSIQAFDVPDDAWQSLERENKSARHLRMPCCASQVALKRSRLGRPFFAHKALDACATAPEREEHLCLKSMAVVAARANGWEAETEVTGTAPCGERWRADVLAWKGTHKVAVEIQWSGQTNAETLQRQELYKKSGVRGLWLLRQPGFPVTRDLPAACIGGSLEHGFAALIPRDSRLTARDRSQLNSWKQIMPMEEFLDAAFGRRLRFSWPIEVEATVSVQVGPIACWHPRCRATTRIVSCVRVAAGPSEWEFSIRELGEHPPLLRDVLDQLPRDLGIGAIKSRFSKAMNRSYISNGCFHCDNLVGEHFEIHVRDCEETVCTFRTGISAEWRDAVIKMPEYDEEGWAVYLPSDFRSGVG